MAGHVDAVVVGLGGAGSAAAWALARRGRSVVGLDQFDPDHTHGSSHGDERIFRYAYADPAYVGLVVAARQVFDELEDLAGAPLIHAVGNLDAGSTEELDALAAAMAAHGLPVEWLPPDAVGERFPGIAVASTTLFQPAGGWVHAAATLGAMRTAATAGGADLRFHEPVVAVEPRGDGVVVRTATAELSAEVAVVTTGAWAHRLLDAHVHLPPITVTRETVGFFRTRVGPWPTVVHRMHPLYYALPTPDGRLKLGGHGTGPEVDPDTEGGDGAIDATVLEWIARHLPGVDPVVESTATCLYATSPDEDFIVDRVGPIVVGVGLGGHGFKFLPLLGERLADLAVGAGWQENPFRLERRALAVSRSGHK